MSNLLDQKSADEFLQIFGGVAIDESVAEAKQIDGAKQKEEVADWIVSLRKAIISAEAASSYCGLLKARQSRVNSRWRDVLMQLTDAMDQLLLKTKENPGRRRDLGMYEKNVLTQGFIHMMEGCDPSKRDDLIGATIKKLCLSRSRVLRQVGLWTEASNEISMLMAERKAAKDRKPKKRGSDSQGDSGEEEEEESSTDDIWMVSACACCRLCDCVMDVSMQHWDF